VQRGLAERVVIAVRILRVGRGFTVRYDRQRSAALMSSPCVLMFFFHWRWGGSSTQALMPTYATILRIPQMIWVWRATVEWYIDRGKPKNSEKNLSQCHFFPPQIPHGLTRTSAVIGRRLTTWPMVRPVLYLRKPWGCYNLSFAGLLASSQYASDRSCDRPSRHRFSWSSRRSKCWDGFQAPSCCCMLLMQPTQSGINSSKLHLAVGSRNC
jgi:hypothetical protein